MHDSEVPQESFAQADLLRLAIMPAEKSDVQIAVQAARTAAEHARDAADQAQSAAVRMLKTAELSHSESRFLELLQQQQH